MFSLFKSKPLLADTDQLFQIECYKWLITNFKKREHYKDVRIILPTNDFFPVQEMGKDKLPQKLFEQVKAYCGLSHLSIRLVEQNPSPDFVVSPTVVVQNVETNPLGTFSIDDNDIVITYNPDISNPQELIATFAHELSHYWVQLFDTPPPGGNDNMEFATDLCAIFLGFGIFIANSVFHFEQYTDIDSQGWSSSQSGYLTEQECSYALAIFMKIHNIPFDNIKQFCDFNIKKYLQKSIKEISNSKIMDNLF